jgi:hypothetical protein
VRVEDFAVSFAAGPISRLQVTGIEFVRHRLSPGSLGEAPLHQRLQVSEFLPLDHTRDPRLEISARGRARRAAEDVADEETIHGSVEEGTDGASRGNCSETVSDRLRFPALSLLTFSAIIMGQTILRYTQSKEGSSMH